MAIRALAPWHDGPRVHILSNVDSTKTVDVRTSLDLARSWEARRHSLLRKLGKHPNDTRLGLAISLEEDDAQQYMVAAIVHPDQVVDWGILEA